MQAIPDLERPGAVDSAGGFSDLQMEPQITQIAQIYADYAQGRTGTAP